MRVLGALALSVAAVVPAERQCDPGVKCVVLPLPTGWREAAPIRLILEDVSLPGNRPLKLRITFSKVEGQETTLGTVGIPAVGPDRRAPLRLRRVPFDVTRPLKRLSDEVLREGLRLRVFAVDGRNRPLRDLEWSLEAIRLETKSRDD
jgi:hypothetical protein